MAKAGNKIKEFGTKIADWILPKSTKEAVKEAAKKAAGADDASIDAANITQEEKDALKKARDEAYNKSASEMMEAAGGYNEAVEAGQKGELSKLGLGKDVSERMADAQEQATNNLTNEQDEEARKARVASAGEEDVARKAAYQAARNTGANRAASSAIGSSVDTRGLQSNAASALRSAATSTQADYLNKMGYVQGLESNLENTKAGSFLNTLSGVGQGVMAGAGTGASIGGFLPF